MDTGGGSLGPRETRPRLGLPLLLSLSSSPGHRWTSRRFGRWAPGFGTSWSRARHGRCGQLARGAVTAAGTRGRGPRGRLAELGVERRSCSASCCPFGDISRVFRASVSLPRGVGVASPEPWPARGPCRFSPSRCRRGQTRPHWIGWALIDVASVLIGRGGVGHRHREETPWTTRTCRGDGHVVMGAETGVARPDPGSTRGLGPPRGWERREEPPRPPDGWALPTAGPRPLTSGPRFLLLYAPQSAVAVRGLYRGCQPWLQGPALGERERSGRGRNS